MMHPTTLLVTQDPSLVNSVNDVIQSIRGFRLLVVPDVETASNEIVEREEIVVTLVHLDGTTNVSGLTRVLQIDVPERRRMVTIVISEHAHPEQALIFSRLGVAECVSRPLDLSRLSYLIDILTIEARYGLPPRPPIVEPDLGEVRSLGDEPPFYFLPAGRMGRAVEQIKRIAPLDTTVMIGGETGTGKTHLAGVIHRLSPRRDQPFLTINCGALATNLVESEMFGHARGAFTGADAEPHGQVRRGRLRHPVPRRDRFALPGAPGEIAPRRRGAGLRGGRLEQDVAAPGPADRGQQSTARARGGRRPVPLRPVLPAQRRRLRDPAVAGADRRRPGAGPPQLAGLAARNGRQVDGIAPAAMQALLAYSWPGNVRELRNVIERALALGHGSMIELDDLPEHLHPAVAAVATPLAPAPALSPARSPSDFLAALASSVAAPDPGPQASQGRLPAARSTLAESKDQTERAIIAQALERNSYNRLRAAADLGISRMTLYKKLHKYGLMGA